MYLFLLADNVKEEPALTAFATEVKGLHQASDGPTAWPFGDFIPARKNWTIGDGLGASLDGLSHLVEERGKLSVVPEAGLLFERMTLLRTELAKLRLIEMSVKCLLEAEGQAKVGE